MDDEMLNTQCRAVAACIKGLSLVLLEAGGGSGSVAKVITEVHKLIQSFRLLGNHYASELVKKCRELEKKTQEVKELSRKLEQGESQKPDRIPVSDAQRQQETTIPGGGAADVEVLSVREQDDPGNVPRSHTDIFQTLNGKPEELDKCPKGLARLEGDLDDYREEWFEVQEQVGKMGMYNEFPSRGFGQAPHTTLGIKPGERSSGINVSTAGCNKQNVDSSNELGAIELNRNKRRRKFIDLGSDSEERKRSSDSTSLPTARKPNEKEDSHLQLSRQSKQETVQGRVLQEQNMVETLCKTMEHYQHEFLDDFLGSSAYNNEVVDSCMASLWDHPSHSKLTRNNKGKGGSFQQFQWLD